MTTCNGSGYAVVNQYGGVGDCPGCPDCNAALSALGRRAFFRVEVSDHDGQIVAIEPEMLCGRDIGDAERAKIEVAIEQLRAFIGAALAGERK